MARVPLSEPFLRGNEWRYVKECIDTGWVSSAGSFVDRFESAIAEYVGSRYAVALVNGTAALHVSLIISGVQPDDEVLVPTLTFVAPVNAVRYCGAYPVFFDCDPETLCVDVRSIAAFLAEQCERRGDGYTYNRSTGRRVSAVIPVHVFGHPTDMDPLVSVCRAYNLRIIEDATESLGSNYKGRKTGTLGDIGCLSFNGNKIITTGGGGMIVTDNEVWAKRARHISTQAKLDPFTYDHDEIGYNYRLTNVQAALGVAQLECLEEFITLKRTNVARYQSLLATIPSVRLLDEAPWARSNCWFYTLRVPTSHKDLLIRYLVEHGIEARPVWKLIHTLPMYRECAVIGAASSHDVHASCLNLPCSVNLSEQDIIRVVDAIRTYTNSSIV